MSLIIFRMGGILPTMARDWHESNIERVVDTALKNARITMNDVNAIAVTVKPGIVVLYFCHELTIE